MEDSNHDLVITGCMFRFSTGLHSLLMTKFDENGTHLRTRNYYGGTIPTLDYNHWGYSIVEKGDGDYLVAGRMVDDDGNDFILLFVVESDLTGQVGWWVGDSDDQACAYSIIRTSDGGYALTGVLAGPGDAFISRRDSNVDPLWQRKLTTNSSDGRCVVQTFDGGLVVTGEYSRASDDDVLFVKWDADGNLVWSRSYGGDEDEIGHSLTGQGLWIAGTTNSWGAGSYDALLIKRGYYGEICLPDKGGPASDYWSRPEGVHPMDRNYLDPSVWDCPGQETDPTQEQGWSQEFVCDDECREECCLDDGSCEDQTPYDCDAQSGVFQGAGTTCDTTGACCLDDETCVITTQACCERPSVNGIYQGDGTACSPTGACCLEDGSCITLPQVCCEDPSIGGDYQGDGSSCTTPQACCRADGSCVMVDPLCWNEIGCTLQGVGTVCTPPRACCLDDGSCIEVDPLCCEEMGGWVPVDPYCEEDTCAPRIPTFSQWGIIAMSLLVLTVGTIILRRRCRPAAT